MNVSMLFEKNPLDWSFKGDPHLWAAMKKYFGETPLPSSREEMVKLLSQAFQHFTTGPYEEMRIVRFEKEGDNFMTAEFIDANWWREASGTKTTA